MKGHKSELGQAVTSQSHVHLSPAWDVAMRSGGLTEAKISWQATKMREDIYQFWIGGPQDARQRREIKGEVFMILERLAREAGVLWSRPDRQRWLTEPLSLRSLGLLPPCPETPPTKGDSRPVMPVPHEEIGHRIFQVRQTFGLTQAEFARSLGLLQAYISSVEGGRAAIKTGLLIKLANWFPDLNLRWLLTGIGLMRTPALFPAADAILQERGSVH